MFKDKAESNNKLQKFSDNELTCLLIKTLVIKSYKLHKQLFVVVI
jgi:hypothetical protein